MQTPKPTRPAAVLGRVRRPPAGHGTPALRRLLPHRDAPGLRRSLTVPRPPGGRDRLTAGQDAAQGTKPPWANPRAVPTKAATSPVTMIIRSSRVAEINCA